MASDPIDDSRHEDTAGVRLVALRREHRELDAEIVRLQHDPAHEELTLKRLKKRKLLLKDAITRLESDLIPDEPA
ncbi:YdcH family protein [Luteimonas sp. WGS1318]|uniref:YdcH family protein n=1 Tax=Luteimonas sp. WGS1318 TaxID=3366815 RepID=UPI00372D026A